MDKELRYLYLVSTLDIHIHFSWTACIMRDVPPSSDVTSEATPGLVHVVHVSINVLQLNLEITLNTRELAHMQIQMPALVLTATQFLQAVLNDSDFLLVTPNSMDKH